MKTKNKRSRIKITYIDEEAKEISQEEDFSTRDYERYEDMEKRISEIEQKAGRFLREEAVKKKNLSWWRRVRRRISGWVGTGRKK